MAQIDTYTVDTTINDADKVIGSDSANSDVTRNFRMDDISDYVRNNVVLADVTDVTGTELAILDGATITTDELNILDGLTATAAELNILDGATLTTAELNYVDGVTSSIQTQLDGKEGTISGAATTITSSNLTASRALVSNASGKVAVSDVTSTELSYLDGVTSAIQTQIDGITEFEPGNTGSANQILQKTSTGYQWVDASNASYTLTAATSSVLGGVIVEDSSDIDVDSSGKLTLGSLSANKITSGTFAAARIPSIDDAKISSVLSSDSSNATDGYVLTADGSGGVAWESAGGGSGGHTIQDDGTDVTTRGNLNFASPLTVTDDGATDDRITIDLTLAASDIPNLAAGKITSGVFSDARLSTDTPTDGQVLTYKSSDDTMHWTHKGSATVTFGDEGTEVATWAEGNNTDTLPTSKIPNLAASKITSGILGDDVQIGDQNSDDGFKFWHGTHTEYNALSSYDSGTIYITDGGNSAALNADDITTGSLDLARLDDGDATDGQVLTWVDDSNAWIPQTLTHRVINAGGNQLSNSESLDITAGTGMTITEANGVVTFSASSTSHLPDLPADAAADTSYTLDYDQSEDSYSWGVASNASVRTVTAGGNTLASDESLDFVAGTNITITESGGDVTITATDTNTQLSDTEVLTAIASDNDTHLTAAEKTQARLNIGAGTSSSDTTYTAGTGLTLTGTSFSLTDVYPTQPSGISDDTQTNYVLRLTDVGGTETLSWEEQVDNDTTYTAGTNVTISASNVISSTDTNTHRTVTAGGNTLDSDETLAFTAGTGISISETGGAVTITSTVTDTNTTYTAGTGLSLSGTTFNVDNPVPALPTGSDNDDSTTDYVLRLTDGSDDTYSWAVASNVTDTVRTVTAGGNTLASDETLAFTAGTNITITESAGAVTIAATDTNTTYTAGTGLTLTGTTFATDLPAVPATIDTDTSKDYVLRLTDASDVETLSWVEASDNDTTYTAGTGLTLTGTSFSLTDVYPTQPSGIDTDTTKDYVLRLTDASDTETLSWVELSDTDTTYTAGDGLTLTGTTFSLTTPITVTSTSVSDGTNTFNKFTLGTNLSRLPDTLADPSSIASDHAYTLMVDASEDEYTWLQFADDDTTGGTEVTVASTGVSFAVHSQITALSNATDGYVLTADGAGGVAWEANPDTNTTYTAGTGLTLTGTSFSLTDVYPTQPSGIDDDTTKDYILRLTDSGGTETLSWAEASNVADTVRTVVAGGNTLADDENLTFVAGTNVTITEDAGSVTIASTDTNTTYTAGTGITLTGTAFSLTDVYPTQPSGISDDTTEDYVLRLTDSGGTETLSWVAQTDTNTFRTVTAGGNTLGSTEALDFVAGTNVTITEDGGDVTISATDTNTTYTAGTGLTLTGTSFATNLPDTPADPDADTSYRLFWDDSESSFSWVSHTDNDTVRTVTAGGNTLANDETLAFTAGTNVTITESGGAVTIAATDTNTTYTAGTGLSLTGTTFATDLPAVPSDPDADTHYRLMWDDSASSFSWDSHTDSDTTYTAGTGLTLTGTSFSLTDVYPTQPSGIDTDTSKDYVLRLTDSSDTETLSWVEATDNDTTYTAGTGLSLSGTTFNVDSRLANLPSTLPTDGDADADYILQWDDSASAFIWTTPNYTVNTDTTYTAGTGLTLTGTSFSVTNPVPTLPADPDADTEYVLMWDDSESAFAWATNSDANTFRTITAGGNTLGATETLAFTAGSNVTITESGGAVTIAATDTNTTYTASNGLTLTGTAFSTNLPDIPADAASDTNYVLAYDQSEDTYSWATAAEGVTYTAGTGMTLSGGAFSVDQSTDFTFTGSVGFTPGSGEVYPDINGTDPALIFRSSETSADGNEVLKLQGFDNAQELIRIIGTADDASADEGAFHIYLNDGSSMQEWMYLGTDQNVIGIGETTSIGSGARLIAIGEDATTGTASSTYQGNISLGYNANSTTTGTSEASIAIGRNTVASGHRSVAIGDGADATGANSVAIGQNAQATAGNRIVLGTSGQMTEAVGGLRVTTLTGAAGKVVGVDAQGDFSVSDLPALPSGISDDTSANYQLTLTDVGGTETLTWSTITDNDTTYTAGTGLTLTGTTFSLTDVYPTQPSGISDDTTEDYVLRLTDSGGTETLSWVAATDNDTTYTAGTGIAISASNVISSTVTDTDTTYTAGTGLTLTGTTFSVDNPMPTNPSGIDTDTTKDYVLRLTDASDTETLSWVEATDNNSFRTVTAGGNTLGATETLAFTAGSNVTITEDGGAVTIASTDTNTTYTAGTGLTLTGTTFSLTDVYPTQPSGIDTDTTKDYVLRLTDASDTETLSWVEATDNNTFRTVTAGGNTLGADETLAFTAGTGITITESGGAVTITSSVTDTDTTYTAGTGLSLTGTTFATDLPAVPSTIDTDTSKNYVLTLTDASDTETLSWTEQVDNDTTYTAGTNVSISASNVISSTDTVPTKGNIESALQGLTASLTIEGTDSGLNGPSFNLFHDSSSPAVNDQLGTINFQGDDSGGTKTTFASIQAIATNVTDTSEAARLIVNADDVRFADITGGSGQFVTIDANGSIGAATPPDTNTTYTAGTGITLTGTAFSLDQSTNLDLTGTFQKSGTGIQTMEILRKTTTNAVNGVIDFKSYSTGTTEQAYSYISGAKVTGGGTIQIGTFNGTAVTAAIDIDEDQNVQFTQYTGGDGQFLAVDSSGNLSAATPTDTTYTAGTGISITGTTIASDLTASELGNGTLPDGVLLGDLNSTGGLSLWVGTKAEYDAVSTKSDSVIYITTDE